MDQPCQTEGTPGFCPDCGSIIPPMKSVGGSICYLCQKEHDVSVFGDMRIDYNIHFNKIPNEDENESSDDEQAEGPVVDRKCSKCGNDKMSYACLQLRSADEGQTVFFTCTKCKFKESENS
ncbi:DNA-directed RNA polymerase I subunit RPA12 [Chironomus tepperi]|uniref:DNA-directed RNA polymerase I subunit RPA12 n=1 Tax=Chironomus tepperi TaxID=113505 RepID=UPI00391F23DF